MNMWHTWRQTIVLLAALTLIATRVAAAQTSQPSSDTYTWFGELVAADANAMTITVKSRMAYPEAVSELKQFKAGEPVWVVWSGINDYSDPVRQIRRPQGTGKINESLVLPAVLVAPEAPNQQVTIQVKVPQTALSAITAIKPGEWVTVTSRHHPSTEAEAVVAVAPYGSKASVN